jgi:hypothetical protein
MRPQTWHGSFECFVSKTGSIVHQFGAYRVPETLKVNFIRGTPLVKKLVYTKGTLQETNVPWSDTE